MVDLAALVGMLCLAGCSPAEESADPCAENAVTWDSWGAGFFASYCRTCHSVDAPDRYEATEGLNFDTLAEVRAYSERIRVRVIDEQTMPVGGGVPDAELANLETFLSCGL